MAAAGVLTILLPAPSLRVRGAYTGMAGTDTSNTAGGIDVVGGGFMTFTPAVAAPPAGLSLATRVDAAVPLPTPTMVDGRPT